jgi:hypothetical protein
MGNTGVHGRWVHLYINGLYWGIYHVHERPDADYIEYEVTLPANGVLERTGIVLDTSNGIQVYAGGTGISAVSYGIDGN